MTSFKVYWDKQKERWNFTVWFTGGTRIRKVGGRTQRAADQALVQFLASLPKTRKEAARRSLLEELLFTYVDSLDVSPATLRNYRMAVNRFIEWGEDLEPATVRRGEVQRYIQSLRGTGLSSGSIRALVSPLRGAWNYALHIDEGSADPVYGVVMNPWTDLRMYGVRKARRRTQHLTEDQIRDVIAAAKAASPMQGALVGTLIYAGLRSGEIRDLQWSNIDLTVGKHGTIHVLAGKGQKDRTVPVSAPLRELLDEYRDHRSRYSLSMRRYVFCKVNRRVGRKGLATYWGAALENAGVESMPIHCARHTAATLWIRSGVDLRTVQAWLGHESLSMVSLYAHLAPDRDAQVEKVDDYMGRVSGGEPDKAPK